MNTKFSEYVIRQLSVSGVAVIDHVIARELTHDLIWATAMNALVDFTQARPKLKEFLGKLARVSLFEVRFVGRDGWVLVAARDEHDLPARIRNIVGLEVAEIRPYHFAPAAEAKERHAPEEDKPPSHQCTARAEWFEKRALMDPERPKKQPAKRLYG